MNTAIGTFEETFGENRGNDALFFLDDDEERKEEPRKKHLTPQEVLNELELLGCETLDKESIESNLDRLIDWFKDQTVSKMEQQFLNELPEKLTALFMNIKDQIEELDYNATSKMKVILKRIATTDPLKTHFQEYDANNNLSGALENHFRDLVSKLKEQSKKIKKQKNFDKKRKLYEAEKQERMKVIDKTNSMFAEDDMQVKGETAPKDEDPAGAKMEYYH